MPQTMPLSALIAEITSQLETLADPVRGAQQQAYMKSDMANAGVTMGVLRSTCKAAFKRHPVVDREQWLATALQLWHGAQVREARHAAIELLAYNPYQRAWLQPSCLPAIEHMIRDGAWWDYVDALAIKHVGPLLAGYRTDMAPVLRTWMTDDCVWIRRSSILAQLKFRQATDLEFLSDAIAGSITDKDFFARKAIGWALREYSKTDPAWVAGYINRHRHQLSPLSVREGLKVINRRAASGT